MCDHDKFVRDTSRITSDGYRIDMCGGCGEVLTVHCHGTPQSENLKAHGACRSNGFPVTFYTRHGRL